MSKSEIRGKHDEDAMQLRRRSRSVSHPYKEGRPSRANVGAKEDAHHGQHQGPHVSLPEKDKDEGDTRWGRPTPQVGRTWPDPRPGAH